MGRSRLAESGAWFPPWVLTLHFAPKDHDREPFPAFPQVRQILGPPVPPWPRARLEEGVSPTLPGAAQAASQDQTTARAGMGVGTGEEGRERGRRAGSTGAGCPPHSRPEADDPK